MNSSNWILPTLVLGTLIASGVVLADENQAGPGIWPLERLKTDVPKYRVVDDSGPIHSLIYQGEPISGKPTEVFAFYASPKTLGIPVPSNGLPAVVLIHGGGGTAFSDWVWMWAKRGYAAIAMDLSGRRPPAPKYDNNGEKIRDHGHQRDLRKRLPFGGLDHTRVEKFDSIGGTVDDDWPYHAVASVMRAHSLVLSFDEVDPKRTAVTGISWGGYTTCLVASLDNRFKAAVPVYGCGFLHQGESVQKPAIDSLAEQRDAWIRAYDPGSHLAKCNTSIMWVNGTHDVHYVLDSYAKSYALPTGPSTFRIEPRMGHSHPAGWNPKEIGIYLDSVLRDGVPLPALGEMKMEPSGRVIAEYQSQTKLVKAELHYTDETGLRSQRKWRSIPVSIQSDYLAAVGLPADANTYLMTVVDERGAMVSTQVGFQATPTKK